MVDSEKPDFGRTTAVQKYAPGLAWLPRVIRDNLTPAAAWSTLCGLAIVIGYVLNAQHAISTAQADVHRLEDSVATLEREREVLHTIDTRIAVMTNKIDDIATEVNRQREWRDNIEREAESPPHARRR